MKILRDKEEISKFIKNSFYHNKKVEINFIEKGREHISFLVDKELVFRFPKHEKKIRTLQLEEKRALFFKSMLQGKLNIEFPNYKFEVFQNTPFSKHSFIKGENVTQSFLDHLTLSQRKEFSNSLSDFLVKLHSIPLKKIDKTVFPKSGTEAAFRNNIFKDINFLKDYYSLKDLKKISDIKSEIENYKIPEKDYALTFCDMNKGNVIIDNKNLNGIIDFSHAGIKDYHLEFLNILGSFIEIHKEIISFYEKKMNKKVNVELVRKYQLCWVLTDLYLITPQVQQGKMPEKTLKHFLGYFGEIYSYFK